MSQLAQYECWVAQYNSVNQYRGPYQMWQYTSTGSVAGIGGNVDLNYCYKDYGGETPDTPGLVQYPMQRNAITAGFDDLVLNDARTFHYGIDISRTQNITHNVFAAHTASVAALYFDDYDGNTVVLQGYYNEQKDILTRYAHLASTAVSSGETVARGQVIGVQGMSGAATAQHLAFETWLVPKDYTYNIADRPRYAVDPVSICHIMPGQLFPFIDAASHNYAALPYPPPQPDSLAETPGKEVHMIGGGSGIYAVPLLTTSPLISGEGRSVSTLVQYCGQARYRAVAQGCLDQTHWAQLETCYGLFWTPLLAGISELVDGAPLPEPEPEPNPEPEPEPGPDPDCAQRLAQYKQAIEEMKRIKQALDQALQNK
jgi:murein DD-endopeptidase MepM/ murein hydrolase activator NlpD